MPTLRRTLGMTLSASIVAMAMLLAAPGSVLAVETHWVNDDDPNGGAYVPPGSSCSDPGYATIQAAVVDAVSGDTIVVCPGEYEENVVLNESLTLLGAQVGVDACGRVASESTVKPANPALTTLELDTGSANSVIDGFTFSGPATRAIQSDTGPIDGLQILNNRIREFTDNGVFLDDNGLNITADQNEIDGTAKLGGGGLFHLDQDNFDGFWFTNNCVVNGTNGTGFFVDGVRNVDAGSGARVPQFTGNFIANNGTGANLGRGAWGDGPIRGNTFSNNLFDGLQGGPKNSLISENNFDNNGRSGLALTSFGNVNPNFSGTGMTAGAQGNNITLNCFTENGETVAFGAGISFSATQFPGTISTNVANQNNIFRNFIGARYFGLTATETIDAEDNWWGHPTGPTHPNNPGGSGDLVVDDGDGIDYDPFLESAVSGTLCVPPPPLPPAGRASGGGQVPASGGRASFGFNAKLDEGETTGHLNYRNHVTGAHLNCTVDAFTELTPTTATFSGTCNEQSSAEDFTAHVEDHEEPGKDSDVFEITYDGSTGTEGGTLTAGNIQIKVEPAPSDSAQSSETGATGAGVGALPSGATFSGIALSGLEVGTGVSIASDGTAAGQFVAVLLGTSLLGQPQEINVDGKVGSGSIGADGSATFSGSAAVDLGDGSVPLLDVPFTVTATTESLLLELGTSTFPSATLTGGSITIE